ncbi:MAG TPA: GAF domain-containing SpoIIE family protein phosphatase, partial [Iamia sp.]|nr:GAF domain-containing SpoIIE family protein phosphatase [Iamia sp.]
AAAGLLDAPVGFVTVVDAERSWHTGAVGLPADGDRSRPIDESFEKLVVATGRALVVNDATVDPRTRDDTGIAASGLRAWAGFPVRDVRGHVLGSFGVADSEPREWTAVQVDALRVLAQAASDQVQLRLALSAERTARSDAESAWIAAETARLALDTARRREHEVIDVLQRSLLPSPLPRVQGMATAVRFDASNDAADIGGDWYDVVAHGGGETTFVIGDVCGHDLPAIAAMAQVRHSLHVLAIREPDPVAVLAELDSLMLEHDFERFATVALLHWSPGTGRLGYVSAGHPPPLVVRADGSASYLVEGRRPPVNLGLAHADPEAGETTLGRGDTVVLYTDGLFESWTPDPDEGLDRLRQVAVAAHRDGPEALADALLAGMRPEPGWADDVALVVARVTGS